MTDKTTHRIPEGALVEIIDGPNAGARLWVTVQCSTAEKSHPLYYLGLKNGQHRVVASERQLRIIHDPDPVLDESIHAGDMEGC